ncbi:MAG: CDP-archaeol synthase [Bordetella sp.]|nr:MAG: CDP-archaeol synthase [Bordetella sp.]
MSPGKTIIGAYSGIFGAVIWIWISSAYEGSFANFLIQKWDFFPSLFIAFILGGLSVIGDLFGSLIKRRVNQKDSGILLPGHGGFYDRIDGILPVVPIALLLIGGFL